METATDEQLEYLTDNEELKRFCEILGVMQSNMMYRILTAKNRSEMIAQLKQEVEAVIIKSERGENKCSAGQVFDEARGFCV